MWEIWVLGLVQIGLLSGILVMQVARWLIDSGLWGEMKQRRRARRRNR